MVFAGEVRLQIIFMVNFLHCHIPAKLSLEKILHIALHGYRP